MAMKAWVFDILERFTLVYFGYLHLHNYELAKERSCYLYISILFISLSTRST